MFHAKQKYARFACSAIIQCPNPSLSLEAQVSPGHSASHSPGSTSGSRIEPTFYRLLILQKALTYNQQSIEMRARNIILKSNIEIISFLNNLTLLSDLAPPSSFLDACTHTHLPGKKNGGLLTRYCGEEKEGGNTP